VERRLSVAPERMPPDWPEVESAYAAFMNAVPPPRLRHHLTGI